MTITLSFLTRRGHCIYHRSIHGAGLLARLGHVSTKCDADGSNVALDTCSQAAFNKYHRLIFEHLNLLSDPKMVCAMSLGYADNTRVENTLASEQVPVEGFVRFHS